MRTVIYDKSVSQTPRVMGPTKSRTCKFHALAALLTGSRLDFSGFNPYNFGKYFYRPSRCFDAFCGPYKREKFWKNAGRDARVHYLKREIEKVETYLFFVLLHMAFPARSTYSCTPHGSVDSRVPSPF